MSNSPRNASTSMFDRVASPLANRHNIVDRADRKILESNLKSDRNAEWVGAILQRRGFTNAIALVDIHLVG